MTELKIPKWRARVDMLLPNGATHVMAVYLSDAAADHDGPERLSDLLNGPSDFFPAHNLAQNQLTFVNRVQVSVCRVLQGIEADNSEQFNLPRETDVKVTLQSGAEIHGVLTYVLPEDRARVQDYLNKPERFFPVQQGEYVHLINKQHVAQVEILPRNA